MDVRNIHKVLLAYRKCYCKDDALKMWHHLHDKCGITFSYQTLKAMISDCRNCNSLWLKQLINAIRIPLDYWFDDKKAAELLNNVIKLGDKYEMDIVKPKDWIYVDIHEIVIIQRVFIDCERKVMMAARRLSKDPRNISRYFKDDCVVPQGKTFFSIGKLFHWIMVLHLDWDEVFSGCKLPSQAFLNEDILTPVMRGPHIDVVSKDNLVRSFSSTTIVNEICQMAEDCSDDTGKLRLDAFRTTLRHFFNGLSPH